MFLIQTEADPRDYAYKDCITGASASSTLPDKYKSHYTRIENQGYSSHCVAHAFTSGMEIKEMMVAGTSSVPELSRLFLQSECKKIDGYPNEEGTTIRAALKVLQKTGVCEETLYPWIYNTDTKKNIFPPKAPSLYTNAAKYKIANYASVGRDIELIKRAVYNEGCVFLSNRCFKDYSTSYKGHTLPPSGKYYGNHATVLIGWDDTHTCTYKGKTYTGFFIRLNSYGDRYYAHGEEYVPYEAIESWCLNGKDWFVEAWTAISLASLKNPDYHKLLSPEQVINPVYTEIILTIGSSSALVDGALKKLDTVPQIRKGTAFIPIRFFTDHIQSALCYWDGSKKQVTVLDTLRNTRFIFTIDSLIVRDRDMKPIYTLLAPPFIQSGRTYLPIRAYSELLGAKVDYIPSKKQIIIRI